MKKMKRPAALLLAALLLLSLAACGASGGGEASPAPQGGGEPAPAETPAAPAQEPPAQDAPGGEEPVLDMTLTDEVAAQAKALVQGKLDELYAGRFDQEYLSLRGIGEEESREAFQTNLSEQAAYFAIYFDIDNLTDELAEEIAELWTEIYGMARYTVGEVEAVGDGKTFAVSVTVEPMDLIRQMTERQEDALAPYYQKYGKTGTESFSEEKLVEADALWAQCILDLARDQMTQIKYLEAQTVDVLVTLGEDGLWTVADGDLYLVDDLIAYFPDII